MSETDITDIDIFGSAVSIKDRYKPTDVIFMHLFNISKLSDHVFTVVDNGKNPNTHNYKNMIDMLWMFMADSIDEIAEDELSTLEDNYKDKTLSDTDIILFSTEKLGIFMKLLSRHGMWMIKEVSDEI